MIEFLTGWAAFALVLGIILCGLYLVLKIFASFGNRTLNSAFFAVVLLGGPFIALGYVWYVLVRLPGRDWFRCDQTSGCADGGRTFHSFMDLFELWFCGFGQRLSKNKAVESPNLGVPKGDYDDNVIVGKILP